MTCRAGDLGLLVISVKLSLQSELFLDSTNPQLGENRQAHILDLARTSRRAFFPQCDTFSPRDNLLTDWLGEQGKKSLKGQIGIAEYI